jgi:hypothetical protein
MQGQSDQQGSRAQVFRRELPGGGYVVIGIERPTGDRAVARTCVWVERRTSDGRQADAIGDDRHSDATAGGREADAPMIASVDGDEQSAAFTEMYRLAADNAAVARGLMQWRARERSIQRAD